MQLSLPQFLARPRRSAVRRQASHDLDKPARGRPSTQRARGRYVPAHVVTTVLDLLARFFFRTSVTAALCPRGARPPAAADAALTSTAPVACSALLYLLLTVLYLRLATVWGRRWCCWSLSSRGPCRSTCRAVPRRLLESAGEFSPGVIACRVAHSPLRGRFGGASPRAVSVQPFISLSSPLLSISRLPLFFSSSHHPPSPCRR